MKERKRKSTKYWDAKSEHDTNYKNQTEESLYFDAKSENECSQRQSTISKSKARLHKKTSETAPHGHGNEKNHSRAHKRRTHKNRRLEKTKRLSRTKDLARESPQNANASLQLGEENLI